MPFLVVLYISLLVSSFSPLGLLLFVVSPGAGEYNT